MRKFVLFVPLAMLVACSFDIQPVHASTVTFLTSGTSYSTPYDWNNGANTIECVGSGGNGARGNTTTGGHGGGGGGGGAYAKVSNVSISGSVSYVISSAGGTALTYFNTTGTVSCDYGRNAATPTFGAGGLASNSTGTVTYNGGNGANGASGSGGGGGAGGAAGLHGAGNAGSTSGGAGGSGDAGSGGSAGGAGGGAGGNGTEYSSSPAYGSGGGGGGGTSVGGPGPGGAGGSYGAGGGGGTGCINLDTCTIGNGAAGYQGLIVITYTPNPPPGQIYIFGGQVKITGGSILVQ